MTERPKLLIIEDDIDLIEVMKITLKAKNYQVKAVFTPEEGLQAAKKEKPDLIILDILMPVMDGVTLARKIREELCSSIPIIMLTSVNKKKVRKSAYAAGATAYLTKPVDYNQLIQLVNELVLPENEQDKTQPLQFEASLDSEAKSES